MNSQEKEKIQIKAKEEDLLEILDILKDKDVKPKDLLVRVYDMESGKEGWISVAQIFKFMEESIK